MTEKQEEKKNQFPEWDLNSQPPAWKSEFLCTTSQYLHVLAYFVAKTYYINSKAKLKSLQ